MWNLPKKKADGSDNIETETLKPIMNTETLKPIMNIKTPFTYILNCSVREDVYETAFKRNWVLHKKGNYIDVGNYRLSCTLKGQ